MIEKTSLITTRAFLPGDRNFIMATWLRGLYYGDSWFSLIPKDMFMRAYHKVVEHLVNYPGVIIKVACLKDDPEVILGYSVSRVVNHVTVLDWLFVKSSWRRIGIGKSLVPGGIQAVSHLTKLGIELKPSNVYFNPFTF